MNIFGSILGAVDSAVAGDPIVGTNITISRHQCRITEKLGEGAFGAVYKCTTTGGGFRAVKHCRSASREQEQLIQIEIDVMERLQPPHPHVVEYYGYAKRPSEFFILMEFCEDSLVHIMQTIPQHFNESTLLRILHHICLGLQHVHSRNYIHRDMKPANVLLASNQKFKLCDFGSCVEWPEPKIFKSKSEIDRVTDSFERFTTPQYRPPEFVDLYQRKPLGQPLDIWATGCMFYEMVFFRHPFPEGSKVAIIGANYRVPKNQYSKKITKLLKIMLHKDPTKRPSIDQLVEHIEDVIGGGNGTFKRSKRPSSSPASSPREELTERKQRSQTEVVSRKGRLATSQKPAPTSFDDGFADFDADWGSPGPAVGVGPPSQIVPHQSAPAAMTATSDKTFDDFGDWDPFGSPKAQPAAAVPSPIPIMSGGTPPPRSTSAPQQQPIMPHQQMHYHQQMPPQFHPRPIERAQSPPPTRMMHQMYQMQQHPHHRGMHQHHQSLPTSLTRPPLQIKVSDEWGDFPTDSAFGGSKQFAQSSPQLVNRPASTGAMRMPMESLIDQPVITTSKSLERDPLAVLDEPSNPMERSHSAPPGGDFPRESPYAHLVVQLNVMGFFNKEKCLQALDASKGDVTRAVEWLLQDEQKQRMGR